MWYRISKLLLLQGKRKVLEQNRLLSALAMITFIFIQTVTFLILYLMLDGKEGFLAPWSQVLPWFTFFTFFISLLIIYLFSKKFPSVLHTLPFSKTSLYMAYHIPTMIFIALLWIGQIGFYLPFFLLMEVSFYAIPAWIGFILLTSLQTVGAAFIYNLLNSFQDKRFGQSLGFQVLFLVSAIMIMGFYHLVWTKDRILFNPALWYGEVLEGHLIYLGALFVALLLTVLLVAWSYRFVHVPEYRKSSKVRRFSFTSSPFINGWVVTGIFFLRDSERRKSVIVSFLVGLVMIDGLYLLLGFQDELFFYFFIMVLGLGFAHVMPFHHSEEQPLTRFFLNYFHFLLAKVAFVIVASSMLLTIALGISTALGYELSGSTMVALYSAQWLFIAVSALMRLFFLKHGTSGEATYSMLSMVVFSFFSFLTGSMIPRFIQIEDPAFVMVPFNLLLAVGVLAVYIQIYKAKLREGGAYS